MQIVKLNREEIFREITNHTQFSSYFREKLMFEHSWEATYTDRAIVEYRRFIYLIILKKFNFLDSRNSTMIPSYAVDQIWHQHILFTRAYQAMCEALGYFIHHQPNEEEIDLRDEYTGTLEAYHKEFHEITDFWPKVDVQFQEHAPIWVSTDRYDIVSKYDDNTSCFFLVLSGVLILGSLVELIDWRLAIGIIIAIYILRNSFLPKTTIKPNNIIKNPPVYSCSSCNNCGGG